MYRGTNRKTLHIMAEAVNASLASSKYLEYFTRESDEQVRCNLCWEKKVSKKYRIARKRGSTRVLRDHLAKVHKAYLDTEEVCVEHRHYGLFHSP